ncbi:MAG TPA: hypothetical protein VJH22_01315 [Candidatus Nanoarchaeia archaeon]|nr:hypothetical protein [Candidatus Nanoarchaeia archaeon]
MADRMDFNRNLSRYLSARKRWRPRAASPFSLRLPFSKVELDENGEAPPSWTSKIRAWYGEMRSSHEDSGAFLHRRIAPNERNSPYQSPMPAAEEQPMPEPYEELPEAHDELDDDLNEEPRVEIDDVPPPASPGLFQRIGGWFSRTPDAPVEHEIQEVFVDELRGDLKVLATNFVGILEHMSHREREKIKQTEQFTSMKDIFRKHNIIK